MNGFKDIFGKKWNHVISLIARILDYNKKNVKVVASVSIYCQ